MSFVLNKSIEHDLITEVTYEKICSIRIGH
jgi:hypothetical protein